MWATKFYIRGGFKDSSRHGLGSPIVQSHVISLDVVQCALWTHFIMIYSSQMDHNLTYNVKLSQSSLSV